MFALIHNNNIRVGPRAWSKNFFVRYVIDNDLGQEDLISIAPATEPIVATNWKILPVTTIDQPSYDPLFEQLAGPTWTINENNVTGAYTVVDLSVDMSKAKLKETVAAKRYEYEIGDLYVEIDNTNLLLFTDRENRTTYLDALLLLPDDVTTYNFKFRNGVFKAVNKPQLQTIVTAGVTKIQTAFTWEATLTAAIDAATTIEDLQAISLDLP